MSDRLVRPAILFAAVGSGLMALLFFVFSTFVMNALGRKPVPQGITTMQSINVSIVNPAFLFVFLGTPAACALIGVNALSSLDDSGARWRLAGAVLYIVGVFLVTAAMNVPLNNALAKVDPTSADGARMWEHYRSAWTAWNHVRAVAAAGATAFLTLAFVA